MTNGMSQIFLAIFALAFFCSHRHFSCEQTLFYHRKRCLATRAVVCSTKLRLGLLLVAAAASVACLDPSQPENSHKAAHIGAGANQHAEICPEPPQRTHATHIATRLGLSARTHRLKLGPKPHRYATHQQSAVPKKGRQKKKKKRKKRLARYRRRVSARARKRPLRLHSSWCSGSIRAWRRGSRQMAPACGAWAVASAAAGRVGGGRDTWATHVTRGVMRRSVGV